MGKPRLIILIRHAQSEGNKNREIHQMIPDHRVKLTDDGWKQAEDAGRRLRHLLRPDDTLQIFTSPYRRTRETTEGILRTLTSRGGDDDDDPAAAVAPSPFSRSKIKVYEEPRLREQDFGNFQPGTEVMERMWKERANYGHFFYRIPNGESAADAYDRVAGFNESLWRQFGEQDFPSVCVLVTHGLMTRVFLMKWYHWSVEYFEDLRNINHCEFILMRQNAESGKYKLENQLRTWSELKRQRAQEAQQHKAALMELQNPIRRNTLSSFLKGSPDVMARTGTKASELKLPAAMEESETDEHPLAATEPKTRTQTDGTSDVARGQMLAAHALPKSKRLAAENDGTSTPHEMSSDDDAAAEYFPSTASATAIPNSMAAAMKASPQRKATPEDIERWVAESGMGRGKQADALGDEPTPDEGESSD